MSGVLEHVERLIVVVGCQRSGTTLTGQIIGAHPDAVLLDEFDGLYPWFHAYADRRPDTGALGRYMVERALAKYRDPGTRFQIAGAQTGLAPNVRCLVLKAPNLTYDDDELARLDVPVTIVYPVRDPRAVVASMARLSEVDFVGNQLRLIDERPRIAARYPEELLAMRDERENAWVRRAAVWRMKSGRSADFQARGLEVMTFRYEDLVREPSRVIAAILEHCKLRTFDSVLNPQTVYTGVGPGGTDRTRAIDAASTAQWQAQLDAAQQREVLDAAGPLAAALGYE